MGVDTRTVVVSATANVSELLSKFTRTNMPEVMPFSKKYQKTAAADAGAVRF